jgi:hypothetical protein
MAAIGGATGVTLYCAGLAQDFLCGRVAVSPEGFWCALGTAGDANSGITELVAANYARQPVSFGRTLATREANLNTVNFGPPVGTPWTIAAIALFDAVTIGNDLFVFVPDATIVVPVGQPLTIDIAGLTFGFASIA